MHRITITRAEILVVQLCLMTCTASMIISAVARHGLCQDKNPILWSISVLLKVFFPLLEAAAILGQPTVRFIRPEKPKCSLLLEPYLGPPKTSWKPGIFFSEHRKLSFWWFISQSLDNFLKAWTSFALSEKRESLEGSSHSNFYGIEKKGVDGKKSFPKETFFSCQEKLK